MSRSFRTCRTRHYTLMELMIASTIGLAVSSMVITFVVMASGRMKSGQSQLTFNHRGRFGGQRITNLVRNARIVSSTEDGLGALIVNEDRTVSLIYLNDTDDNPEGISTENEDDNVLMYDPDIEVVGDEEEMIPRVVPIEDEPMFSMMGAALAVRFHTGDTFPASECDHLTGKGYQGIRIRILAKPRNAAELWSNEE